VISRRQFFGATAAGVMAGLAGVAVTRGEATIRLIGRRSSIIALLDNGTERVLMVLGSQDDDLLMNIPGLKTVGNTRVDLVIASHRILATRAARHHLNIETTPTLAIQAHASLPPIHGNVTPIVHPIVLGIGNATTLQVQPTRARLTGPEAEHPEFLITVDCVGRHLILASGDQALLLADGVSPAMLVVPGSPGTNATTRLNPQVLVSNSPATEGIAAPQIQVFRTDPAVVRIHADGLILRDDQLSS
jgi:hypothetical protein